MRRSDHQVSQGPISIPHERNIEQNERVNGSGVLTRINCAQLPSKTVAQQHNWSGWIMTLDPADDRRPIAFKVLDDALVNHSGGKRAAVSNAPGVNQNKSIALLYKRERHSNVNTGRRRKRWKHHQHRRLALWLLPIDNMQAQPPSVRGVNGDLRRPRVTYRLGVQCQYHLITAANSSCLAQSVCINSSTQFLAERKHASSEAP